MFALVTVLLTSAWIPSSLTQSIKIGVLWDPAFTESGPRTGLRLQGMEARVRELANTDVEILGWDRYLSAEDMETEVRADFLSGVLVLATCEKSYEDVKRLKRAFPTTLLMVALDRGCLPKPGFDLALPYISASNDIVPLLAHLKNGPLNHWKRVFIIFDDTLGLNDMEVIVSMFMAKNQSSSVLTFSLETIGNLQSVLSSLHNEDGNFLLLAKDVDIQTTLREADSVGLLDRRQEWVVVSLEKAPTPALQRVVEEAKRTWNLVLVFPHPEPPETSCINEKGCQIEILLRAFGEAAGALISNGTYRTDTSADLEATRLGLRDLMKKGLEEETGCGLCVRYIMKSTSLLGSGDSWHDSLHTVGEWSPLKGLQIFDHLFPATSGDFKGKRLILGILDDPPLSRVRVEQKRIVAEGFVVDIVRHLSKVMNFTYDWKIPQDGQYGLKRNDGTWTGLIGMLLKKEIEFVAQGFWPTGKRMEAVNFSTAIDEVAYQMLVKRPQLENRYLFLSPFTGETWICVLITVVVMGPILCWVHRASKYNEYYDLLDGKGLCTYSNCIWYCFGSVVQQGGIHLPEALSGRVLVGFWWIFVIVTVTTYSGNLVAVLTFPKIRNPIDSVPDLLDHKDSVKWCVFDGEAIVEVLESAKGGPLKALSENVLYSSPREEPKILESIRENKMVFIGSDARIAEITYQENLRRGVCDYITAKYDVQHEAVALPVPRDWAYLTRLNHELLKLIESGLILKWKRDSWPKENDCTVAYKPQAGDTRKIGISEMMGSFYILAFGFTASVLSFLVEMVKRAKYKPPPLVQPKDSLLPNKEFYDSENKLNKITQDQRLVAREPTPFPSRDQKLFSLRPQDNNEYYSYHRY